MANGLTSKQHAFVAAYIGVARGNASEAARIAEYAKPGQEGHRLLKIAEIDAAIQQWRNEVKTRGIASLEYRVQQLDDMEQGYQRLIDARKEAYANTSVIGGDTGLVVLQQKMVGSGPDAQFVEEYVADTAVTKEIRAIYDDVAKELGQRVDKVDVSGSLTREYVIVRPGDE